MALVLKNRVKVTSTTTGTGTFTLGSAVDGYQDFSVVTTADVWDISGASYSGDSFSVLPQDTVPTGVFFKPDGTKMYVTGGTGDDVNEYNLSTPWLVSSASYVQNFSVASQDTSPQDLFFKPDGTAMYIAGDSSASVLEYSLSTAWDISSATYVQAFSVSAQEAAIRGLFFKPDGTKMYIVGLDGDEVNEYDLGTPWDISTASYVQNFSVASQESAPSALSFDANGTTMYVIGLVGDDVNEYALSVAWDISSASYTQNFYVGNQDTAPQGLFFKPDGSGFYVVGSTQDMVFSYYIGASETYYIITDGTDFEAGVGTVFPSSELVRSRVFASSNSNALVNWGAGDKDVLCGYPAEGTPGGIPFCDDSEIGTDLSGWQAFRTALESGITGGQTYNNNGANGIVSTYGLVYTTFEAYSGGVISPNGEIHFIPRSARVGQKINLDGTSSTYSLVYTTTSAYAGGVLAPNGDIHFVPDSAAVGQKINASGVVSTYSLVYTASDAYRGGVLAPNGDIHFINYLANRGQKVSAAGVVSTYSLVYTLSGSFGAYWGGVLAPNGDIYFVPFSANRGQKISAAGVVSTFALAHTESTAYSGGVLSPNGDIHFIPFSSRRGQKINTSTQVVSTYSLVYTGAASAGGVVSPAGDIYFIPHSGAFGQKVSISGSVSTYALAYTTAEAFTGGVLAFNGDIHFIPTSARVGQKISTNPGQALGPGICLSSFLNKF